MNATGKAWRPSRLVCAGTSLVGSTTLLVVVERTEASSHALWVASAVLALAFVLSLGVLGFGNARPLEWGVFVLDAVALTVLVDSCYVALVLGGSQHASDAIAGVGLVLFTIPIFVVVGLLMSAGAIVGHVARRPKRATQPDSGIVLK